MSKNSIEFASAIEEIAITHEFSICTLVTRKHEYEEMIQSFLNSGFSTDVCEFLYADNIEANQFNGYQALNLFLRTAKGKYLIICHQDILINKDDINCLRSKLTELDKNDSNWAICGNAGAVAPNQTVYHISYPEHPNVSKGRFPAKVLSVDENFIVVKNEALLKVSNQLKGFHLYATDLCLQAELNGFSAYVIAFNLTHKSKGNRDTSFFNAKKDLVRQYNFFFRSRWIQTNSTIFHLSGSFLGRLMGNPLTLFVVRMWNGLKKRMG